jgi:serine/threonine-protein kinase
MPQPYGGQPQQQYQQPPQQQYQQPPQQQYQQPPQQQQYQQQQPQQGYQQPYQQQQAYQQQPQQHMPPQTSQVSQVMAAEPEEVRKSNVGLIIGIIGGVIAILAVVAFFVLGPGLGGKEKKDTGGTGEQAGVSGSDSTPEAAITNVTIDVTPADATVMIDGKEYAGAGPRAIAELAPGTHKLEVSMGDAYLPFSQELTFTAGQSLPIKLEARDVTLNLTVTPANATASLIAGTTTTEIGKGAASHAHKLVREPGLQYTVQATADGFEDLSLPIVFTGDPAQDVPVLLAAKPEVPVADPGPAKPVKKTTKVSKPKNAELKIGVAPGNPPATVTVDGKSEGRTPVFVKVTAGAHTVKWKWDDGKTDTQKATVAENESKLLKGNK